LPQDTSYDKAWLVFLHSIRFPSGRMVVLLNRIAMRSYSSTLVAALLLAKLSSCAPEALCSCGYTVGDSLYTELEETDFTTVQNLLGPAAGWELQEYTLPANDSLAQPYARQMTRDNIMYSNEGLQLVVMPAVNGVVSGAEIATPRSDIHYGSFRAAMRTSSVSGTCGAFFWVSIHMFCGKD
jgi:hypothetical protein